MQSAPSESACRPGAGFPQFSNHIQQNPAHNNTRDTQSDKDLTAGTAEWFGRSPAGSR